MILFLYLEVEQEDAVAYYETYRIEDRKPDAAYIHNSYDHANYVTSVDPRFNFFELKKNVGCLVYVPYYAISGVWQKDRCSAWLIKFLPTMTVPTGRRYINFYLKGTFENKYSV